MGYDSVNKQINDKIQQLAEDIQQSLSNNGDDYMKIDRVLLNKLFELLIPKLKYQIWKYIKDVDASNDLLNDCLLKIYTKIHLYKSEYRFTTWVYTITYNEVISYFKSRSNRKEHPLNFSSMSNINTYIDDIEKLHLPELVDFDLDEVVNSEIYSLPDGLNKDIMIDTQYNRLKIRELANKYNMTESTIKTKQRLTRGIIKNGIFDKYPTLKDNIGVLI